MTYTFKLARRLAVSQHFSVFATIALLAACNGDATAPDAGPPGLPAAIKAAQISPQAITIETNQRVQFRRTTRNIHGDRVMLPSVWAATGGIIGADGTFTSSVEGTFKVTGRGRGWQSDTSIVTVVSQKKGVVRLAVAPDSATVETGASLAFSVNGYRRDGSTTTIGVTWSATGGEIDPAGVFTADSVAGTYQVIAANVAQTLADTIPVRVVTAAAPPAPESPAAPTPEPAAPPAPPSEPTVTAVVLKPGNASLETSATKLFAAYGRTTAGDSVAVRVAFSATGGTIGSNGLYTAGPTSGSFKVIAVASGLADTAVVTLTAPTAAAPTLPSGTGSGIPFGPFAAWEGSSLKANTGMFTLTVTSVTPSNIVSKISEARTTKTKLLLVMTGGAHDNYLTFGVFDRAKWDAKMDSFNQPAIQSAVAGAVADGTIVGNVVMDEPNVSGSGDGNTWGPPGTMTKARVDSLCGYVKQLFPTLPAGVQHRHDIFEPTKSYRVCDFLASQYSSRIGDVTSFRDSGLAMARRDGHAILFAMNIMNGGVQDKDGVWDCTSAGQGGLGTYSPNCRMTAEQVHDVGLTLGPAGCGFMIWRYDATFMADPANQQAFRDIGTRLASATPKACRRS
jgi:hypothetical protein